MKDLQQLLKNVCSEWVSAKTETFTQHPLAVQFRNELVTLVKTVVLESGRDFKVKGSVGAGNWADVAWLSILDPDISGTTQDGIYPVYLFKADGSGVYLSFMQGTTEPARRLGTREAQKAAGKLTSVIRQEVTGLDAWGPQRINLEATTPLGLSYEASNISAKYYPAEAIPSTAELKRDLLQLFEFYAAAKPIWLRSASIAPTVETLMTLTKATLSLPKPFLLLAGISGTGKTRFVRQQAEYSGSLNETYCLVPVRPDWHEPSDLLGYVSRLGVNGARYVVSDILRFIVSAWKEVISSIESINDKPSWIGRDQSDIRPFWLCLDEMNLAPVEQYFADFLSILETRRFLSEDQLQHHNADAGVDVSYLYSCDSILKPSIIGQLDSDGQNSLRFELGLSGTEFNGHWRYFCHYGISLPFNLIVAGTVNMDETAHGFSRKVIDRALTIDFGQFFPNNFDQFFDPKYRPVALSYPMISSVTLNDLASVPVDPDGARSVEFLAGINNILKGTAFELAYRGLNELLLSVVCFAPADDETLYAVWDDFLMMKLLPRIEGDQEKLTVFHPENTDDDNSQDLLANLFRHLESKMAPIWSGDRPDLLRESVNGDTEARTKCRTREKIEWMSDRLVSHGFTSFWP
jgi:hypothetical protein